MISKMTEPCILCGDIQIPTENHFSIVIISTIKELYILCGDIPIPTEKHRLLLKWLQRWQILTFFVGTFKFQMKEAYIFHWDIYNPTGKNSSVSKSFQRWQNLTSFVGTLKFQLKNTVQYWNDFKDHRALHPLRGDSDQNWERQFSIEMLTKMTEPYILWGDFQIPIERTSHLLLGHSNSTEKNSSAPKWFQKWQKLASFLGTSDSLWRHSNSNWKRQFSIEMISKITELYILCGTFKSQLKITVYYRNGKKDDKN